MLPLNSCVFHCHEGTPVVSITAKEISLKLSANFHCIGNLLVLCYAENPMNI